MIHQGGYMLPEGLTPFSADAMTVQRRGFHLDYVRLSPYQ